MPEHIPLPPRSLMFMGEDEKQFVANGDGLLSFALEHVKLDDNLILDIGCGYGRLAYALIRKGFGGKYIGLDILNRHIEWLQQNVTRFLQNYQFFLVDVRNDRYNKGGSKEPREFELPVLSEPPRLTLLFSVFTHMYEDDIIAYLRVISNAMDDQSRMLATFFLLNDDQASLEKGGKSSRPMKHELSSHCRFHDAEDPLLAIGYSEDWIKQQAAEAGLSIIKIVHGTWCGRAASDSFQDAVIFEKLRI